MNFSPSRATRILWWQLLWFWKKLSIFCSDFLCFYFHICQIQAPRKPTHLLLWNCRAPKKMLFKIVYTFFLKRTLWAFPITQMSGALSVQAKWVGPVLLSLFWPMNLHITNISFYLFNFELYLPADGVIFSHTPPHKNILFLLYYLNHGSSSNSLSSNCLWKFNARKKIPQLFLYFAEFSFFCDCHL